MSKPTFEQMQEFFAQVKSDRVTCANFQAYLRNPNGFGDGSLEVSYDQSLGLRALIERAVGPANLGNINTDITPERFKLAGIGVRTVKPRVEPYRNGETSEQITKRLAGCKLGNTGDLAAYLHDHPDEVEKYAWVLAISEDSRWAGPGGDVCVPCARVDGVDRNFDLVDFRGPMSSYCGVLVLGE